MAQLHNPYDPRDPRGQGNPYAPRGGDANPYAPRDSRSYHDRPRSGGRPADARRNPYAEEGARQRASRERSRLRDPYTRGSDVRVDSYAQGQRPSAANPRRSHERYDDARPSRPQYPRRHVADPRREQGHQPARPAALGSNAAKSAAYSRYGAGTRYAGAPKGSSRSRLGSGKAPSGFRLPSLDVGGGTRNQALGGASGLGRARNAVIGIVAAALVVIVAIVLWSNRKVDITVDGKDLSIKVDSTIDQVISEAGVSTTPGNLISVSGNKLADGQGYPFVAKLGGNELDGTATANYRAAAGDELSFENGRDRTEDYDVQVVDEQPKLEMGGEKWGNISYVSQWPKAGKYEMRTGKQSGETARGDQIEDTQNAIVSIHQIKPDDDSKKLVALTFDDGPAEKYTEAYLDILNQYGIHATFFNLGQSIEEFPDLSKKVVEQGSEIMSHTYQHQQLSKLDASALQKEFSTAFAAIKDKVGVDTTGFRPPYGDFTEKAWLNSGGLASVSVLWNQDSLDWKIPGVDTIVANATKNVTSGSIILMHDGGGNRDQDVQALPKIIEKLQADGYQFVTVSELMQSDSSIPSDVASGIATMPEGSTWPTEIATSGGTDGSSSGSGSSSSSGSSGK